MFDVAENVKFVKGLAPAADRWNTNPGTDVVSLRNHGYALFLVHQQGGTTGNATLTVEGCDDVSATNKTAVAFKYRKGAAGASAGGDAMGAWTDATSAGFDTTAAEDALYEILVEASTLPENRPFVRLLCTEKTNDPVNGAVEILLCEPRYAGVEQPTAIA